MAGTQSVAPVNGWAKPPKFQKENPQSVHNKFNINTATKEDLAQINQMTGSRAQSIIDWRDSHGPFHRVSDAVNIPGIGGTLMQAIKDRCYAGDPSEPSPRELYEQGRMEDDE